MQQDQFLTVIDRDEAERRFHAVLDLRPLEVEEAPLEQCLGRVLARDVVAPLDVPGFDRSNVDGFAVRSEDTFRASDERPVLLSLAGETLVPGSTLGVSNVFAASEARIALERGVMLAVRPSGSATAGS